MTDAEELESLRAISPQAILGDDGGVVYVLLPQTRLATPGGILVMDTVLCPRGLGGYVTRLLLEHKVEAKMQLNWQGVMLLGRPWHSWSWNQIHPNQAWLRIYAEHARLLR